MLIDEPLPIRFWVYPVLLLIVGICFRKFWAKRPVWMGMSWFLIHIGLMLHILPLSRVSIIADRYIYLAAPGLFFILIWFLSLAWELCKHYRKLMIAGSIVYLLLLVTLAHNRVMVWHSNATLKKEMRLLLEQRP